MQRLVVQELSLATLEVRILARDDRSIRWTLRRTSERIWRSLAPHAACRTDWCGARA